MKSMDEKATTPADLKDPENLRTEVVYDEKTGTYRLGTRLGDNFVESPFYLTPAEYMEWTMQRSMRQYYRTKNAEEFKNKGKEKFDFTDMQFDLGAASKIFGPGGVRVTTRGSAELKIGANTRFTDNPSLAERNRRVFGFDFDEKINLSVTGKVGDKVNMDFNYNSDATFNFDAQDLKLRYEGKEDEIIKLIEAGNVSMPSNSSLIRGSSALFGVRTDLQFGKLKLQTVISQKKSSAQSVNSQGGAQLTSYEFSADAYDENRHFFLAHFFRSRYNESMKQLPTITSGVTINRVEIWVTNKTGATTNTRNIIAFTDLGEQNIFNENLWQSGGTQHPSNTSNTLYSTLNTTLTDARNISLTTYTLDAYGLAGGVDYEKLESARKLSTSEYTLNPSLGYVSLKSTLQPDQVLAIAYEYTYRGQTYQVGEFASDRKDTQEALYVKSLKNTACTPQMRNWPLMMKNVYSLGATSVQREKFKFDIKYLSDTSGVYLSYIPEPEVKNRRILSLLGLDQLDNSNKRNPNGYFDFVEGITIDAQSGRVFFPVVEPFGRDLARSLGGGAMAERYAFNALYDSTRTIARQIAEKNKFIITGEYRASRNDEIQLNAVNVPRGSVLVTAGGQTLMEGSDYTVDYNSGIVRILNKSILDAGTPINVSLESNTNYGMQRKTLIGLNWQYDFSKSFQVGGSIMHLGEKPLTTKVAMGSEPLNNTLWGLNLSWKKQSQRLTNWLDNLPFIHCTAPSAINFSAEFAQLIAGANKGAQGNASYIDDFESAKNGIDISNPSEWTLSSVPSLFSESKLSNDVRYGYNRALLAWYYIDPLFTRRSSALTPGHIKGDLAQLSDPRVREVYKSELFPNKSINMQESNTLNVLNLAYYPSERGPYNLDPALDVDGRLPQPQNRWGGMMRKLETSDFETANIEYIEFWMLDPFLHARLSGEEVPTGELYFNLGEISEDILKDGKKFFESGLPADDNPLQYTETIWGRVPTQSTVTYAFNTSSGSRQKQDVGFNGLTSEQERNYPAYADFLKQIQGKVRPEVYDSILANPSADKYHYFRGSDFDAMRLPILERYKYINNPNGNSVDSDHSPEKYSTAYKTTPDVEDINQDFTLGEYEKYYQYRVRISPEEMNVGQNYIVDKRETNVQTRDGKMQEAVWYQFRIPVDQYEKREGGISDFSSIRFMRMFMTGFRIPIVLRMATLNLVHGEWRAYEQALYAGKAPEVSGSLAVSAVNFEENNEKQPVNYILPPGISRVIDPGQQQVLQNNEQSLSLTVKSLASGDARAVYKNTNLDLRRYRHLQMFAHANSLPGETPVENGQTSLFVRLGSDYKNNFYEYEIPLTVTPDRSDYHNNDADARIVWPADNMLDIDLNLLTDVKRNRNRQKALGLASNGKLFSEYDSSRPKNKISVMGNPSLGEVRTIMIGVRNNSRTVQGVEVWANELRLQEFSNEGGWAARSALNLQLSDLATVNLTGHVETDGFGGLEESVSQRRDDNLYEYSVMTNVELGRLLPEKAKVNAPIYYSYSKQRTSPRYNPLDTDMELKDAIDALNSESACDSLRDIAERVIENKNFSLSGIRVNITTKKHPMPYDPANFTFGYAYSSRNTTGETTAWEKDQNWKWNFSYAYSPSYKSFDPFKKKLSKSKSKWARFFKEFGLNYLPQNIGFNSDITRSYYELQERDMEQLDNTSLPLSWSSDFLWNRSFTLKWDLTKSMHMNFTSGTNAEIEQPYTAVNKDLYPDHYSAWKDSVWTSIRHMGKPLTYAQSFDYSWKLPLNKFPVFDWITADVAYAATYNWTRGADLDDGTSMGNTINNSRDIRGNGRLNLETLYNHVPFLKKINRKFSTSSASQTKKKEPENYAKEIQLKADTTLTIKHNQKTRKLRVMAINTAGKRYPLKYRVIDANTILVLSRDTTKLKLSVAPRRRLEDQTWYKAVEYTTRALMMVRNVNVNYTNKHTLNLPGFLPQPGDFFGQRAANGLQPGLDFAFGFTDEDYVHRAADRGWLLMSDSIVTPATSNFNEQFTIRATLEPFRDFKIDLNAIRSVTRARSIHYMYTGMPSTQTGSFSISTISIGSAFEKLGSADKGYKSRSFEKFVASLSAQRDQIESLFAGATYPAGTPLAGKPFDPANGTIDKYAPEVMIPAFLKAYTASGDGNNIFPALTRLLPNWSVTYSGLARLPRMKKLFKSFNLRHAYKSVYSVGAYNTFTSFQEYMNGFGFITDVAAGTPLPSSMYDVTTVSVNESFSPLFGVDMTFQNNLTTKVEYRKTRVLTLSMTSQQINETRSNDFVLGFGYKVTGLNLFAPKRTVRSKRSKRKDPDEKPKAAAASGFANDLNLRLDFTLRDQAAINRDIITQLSQATSGNKALQVSFSADYALSRLLTLTAYYDRQMNKPLLTSNSYPITTQDFGVSIKFSLNR